MPTEGLTAAHWLYVALMFLIAGVCAFGVFHHGFDDTFLQRIGMAAMAFGALVEAHYVIHRIQNESGLVTLFLGSVVFALASLLKLRRPPKPPRRAHPK